MLKNLYKTNEFALLCNTTKHTLFHYDKIGLLSPAIRKENGYRYYSIEQFDIFNIINIMKKIGVPLNEIKDYLSVRNKELFVDMLKEKQKKLSDEIKILKDMDRLLSENIALLKEDLSSKINKIQIENCDEEYLIVTQTPKTDVVDEKIIIDTLSKHFKFCKENYSNAGIHMGEIILKEDVFEGRFKVSYCYSKTKEKYSNINLFIKPKGKYAVFYYQGSYSTLSEGYKYFYEEIKKQGYFLEGNIYGEDVVDYFSESNPEKYILKLSAQIGSL